MTGILFWWTQSLDFVYSYNIWLLVSMVHNWDKVKIVIYVMESSISEVVIWMCAFIFASEIAKHLSLPPVKLHCSMLAEDAIKAAVKDYKEKRVKTNDAAAAGETAQA